MTRKVLLLALFIAALLVVASMAACAGPAPPAVTEAPAEEEAEPPEEVATEEAEPEPTEAAMEPGTPMSDLDVVPVFTTSSDVVGIGTVVAAEPYAVAAGEDPATQPVQAFIMPYSIHPNMHVESVEDFDASAQTYRIRVEGFTFEWSLESPDGSSAALTESDGVAVWLADVAGDYVLTLTATDEAGNSGETSWTVRAATYVGVGSLTGDSPEAPECAACHGGKVEGWSGTGHASMFTRAIDGEVSDHYGPNCIWCHTTGFNNRPEAQNGGFDDVAAAAGWEFPAELKPGNWDALVASNPEVAALANVQCESCHGPASDHFTGDVENLGPISRGLEYGVCAQCHAEEPYHLFPQQWERSGHADATAQAFWYPIGEQRAACVQCHTGGGYIDAAAGLPPAERRTSYQPITCAVCHDPHVSTNDFQLRIFDTVTLPDGTEISGAGAAATCMTCHNARTNPVTLVEGESFGTPHYSAAAELTHGTGGYTWGETLPSSIHQTIIPDGCITCHMAETPGTTDDGTPLPGHNEVGGHTFAMTGPDGFENVATCQACHGEQMTTFALTAKGDYDGDGTVGTNEEELAGLIAIMERELGLRGVEILDHYPYFNLPANASVDLKGAVYNFKLVRDNDIPAHNLDYLVALLQLSYEKLTGMPLSGARLLY